LGWRAQGEALLSGRIPKRVPHTALLEACEPRRLLSFSAAVNFQPVDSPTPAGYVADSGLAYGNRGSGYTYGWTADNSANVRDQATVSDQRYDTLAMMQQTGNVSWEIAVPNGTYRVHVVSGDPAFPTADVRIDAEGQSIVNGETDAQHPWVDGWGFVMVNDGKLTLGPGTGAFNTKIDFVEITDDLNSPVSPAVFPDVSHVVKVGTNLDGLSYFDTIGPFNDLATEFNKWGQVATPWIPDGTIPKSLDNYPQADAGAITFASGYPSGDYQVSYRGTGTVSFSRYHSVDGVNQKMDDLDFAPVLSDGIWKGTVHLEKPPTIEGWYFVLTITGQGNSDQIHDLHIISPDADPSISPTFRPVFLQKLATFDGPLRMMDWMQTVGSTTTRFETRTQLTRFSWATSPAGLPYEVLIELANTLHKDLWVNIPHKANDAFITQFADMLRDTLDPSLKVYVEYSNEVWNSSSAAGIYVYNILAPADGISAAQEMGKQTVRVSSIFKTEFGAARYAAQVRTMLGAFIANSFWAKDALDYIKATYGDPKDFIAGIAIAPYVGVESDMASVNNADLTLDQLFAWMHNWIDTTMDVWLKANKGVADQYELALESYEGGQHLQAISFPGNEDVKRAAQDDPRMAGVYQHLISKWVGDGGDIFGNFSLATKYSKFGYWGLLQTIGENDSVKYSAVTGMIGQKLNFFSSDEAAVPAATAPPARPPVVKTPAVPVKAKPIVPVAKVVKVLQPVVLPVVVKMPVFAKKRVGRVFD